MGYDTVGLRVTATTPAHNSDQDATGEALWKELHDAVVALAADPKYASISPMVF